MIKSFALVGLGGAIGSMIRYGIYKLMTSGQTIFPWGTFLINVIGCFIIGVIMGASTKEGWLQESTTLLLATGFCGGFTTFSAFALENVSLMEKQFFSTALLYTVVSVLVGIIVCKLGIVLTR